MFPYKLEKAIKSDKLLYSYKDVVKLVALALTPILVRSVMTIDEFEEKFPDVFEQKMIEADGFISHH